MTYINSQVHCQSVFRVFSHNYVAILETVSLSLIQACTNNMSHFWWEIPEITPNLWCSCMQFFWVDCDSDSPCDYAEVSDLGALSLSHIPTWGSTSFTLPYYNCHCPVKDTLYLSPGRKRPIFCLPDYQAVHFHHQTPYGGLLHLMRQKSTQIKGVMQ